MSYDMRRRQEGTRKRGYLDSTLETTDNNNSYNHSSKAYAVHDSSYEDLDRLIMFITESKQIQGRYFVRYLPGMMNSSGELTPCNYRPAFSFSPPRSPATSSTTSTSTSSNNRFNNRTRNTTRSSLPPTDVVDLTEEDDMISKSSSSSSTSKSNKSKDFYAGIRPYSDGRRIDRRNSGSSSDNNNDGKKENESYHSDDDDGDDEKSGQGSSSSGKNRSAGSISNRKQTARKSMRPRTEVRPSEIPEIEGSSKKSDNNEKGKDKVDDDQEEGENSRHSNTGGQEDTSLSSVGDDNNPSLSESKNKSSKDNNSSSNNIKSNNNATTKANTNNVTNNPSQNNASSRGLSEKWNLLDGITVTVNPDFG